MTDQILSVTKNIKLTHYKQKFYHGIEISTTQQKILIAVSLKDTETGLILPDNLTDDELIGTEINLIRIGEDFDWNQPVLRILPKNVKSLTLNINTNKGIIKLYALSQSSLKHSFYAKWLNNDLVEYHNLWINIIFLNKKIF